MSVHRITCLGRLDKMCDNEKGASRITVSWGTLSTLLRSMEPEVSLLDVVHATAVPCNIFLLVIANRRGVMLRTEDSDV